MKTYQQYKEDKLQCLEQSYRQAWQALNELDMLLAEFELRDDQWETYRNDVYRDAARLASMLPLAVLEPIWAEESQS
jgi:hypothetical protein